MRRKSQLADIPRRSSTRSKARPLSATLPAPAGREPRLARSSSITPLSCQMRIRKRASGSSRRPTRRGSFSSRENRSSKRYINTDRS